LTGFDTIKFPQKFHTSTIHREEDFFFISILLFLKTEMGINLPCSGEQTLNYIVVYLCMSFLGWREDNI
jgi:hypothetical protein